MFESFSELCTPAKFYLITSIIFMAIGLFFSLNIILILIKLLFIFLWTLFLNFLCSNDLTSVAWFLVILPYVFLYFSFILFFNAAVAISSSGITPGVTTGTTITPGVTSPQNFGHYTYGAV